jgi:hypothetical protein
MPYPYRKPSPEIGLRRCKLAALAPLPATHIELVFDVLQGEVATLLDAKLLNQFKEGIQIGRFPKLFL